MTSMWPAVALYARVSTAGKGQDPETQLRDLRREAARREWTIIDTYVDEGWSGRKAKRPELDRMLDDMRRGRFGAVMVWKLDRLGRSLQHLVELIDAFRENEIEFVSVMDPAFDTTSATGKLMFQMTGAFAEYESNLIGERVKAGLARRRAEGKTLGRVRVPLDIDLATLLMAGGKSLTATAKAMNCNKGTLKTRLMEAGRWPVMVDLEAVNKPPGENTPQGPVNKPSDT